jgi:tetratricopeptide (TPR) repeat protein
MINCDLCNKEIEASEAVQIARLEFKEAVREGFNPFETYGFDMSQIATRMSLMGLGIQAGFQRWQAMALDDPSDWAICSRCNEAFRRARGYGYGRGRIADPIVGEHYHAALWLHHRNRQWQECIAELTKAIEHDPTFAEGYYWRAQTHFERALALEAEGASVGEVVASCERAVEDYSRAVELDPSDRISLLERNSVYICLGRTSDIVRTNWRLDQLSRDELRVVSRPYADRYEYLGMQIKARGWQG